MKIVSRIEDGVDTFVLDDRFDAHEVGPFRVVMDKAVRTASVVRLDLSGVRFIDSTALSELLRTRKVLQEAGGRLVLQAVSDPVRVILELTGLSSVFAGPGQPEPARGRP